MDSTSFQATVGANCRRIREAHGVTQAQLASHARRVGLRWTASKVGDFESGRNAVYATVLFAAVLALDNAVAEAPGPFRVWHTGGMTQRKRPRVRLPDLVASDGYVTLNDDFAPTGEVLAAVCSGKPWEFYGGDDATTAGRTEQLLAPATGVLGERYRMRLGDVEDMRRRSTITETRLAGRLGIDPDTLLGLSWRLWRHPFTEERDRRAGVSVGRRGHIARALTTELQAELWKEQTRGNN
jgi:transcriptional regulator with XRE-family HTH domain